MPGYGMSYGKKGMKDKKKKKPMRANTTGSRKGMSYVKKAMNDTKKKKPMRANTTGSRKMGTRRGR